MDLYNSGSNENDQVRNLQCSSGVPTCVIQLDRQIQVFVILCANMTTVALHSSRLGVTRVAFGAVSSQHMTTIPPFVDNSATSSLPVQIRRRFVILRPIRKHRSRDHIFPSGGARETLAVFLPKVGDDPRTLFWSLPCYTHRTKMREENL